MAFKKKYVIEQWCNHYEYDDETEIYTMEANTPAEAIDIWRKESKDDYDEEWGYRCTHYPTVEYEYTPDIQARPHARSKQEWDYMQPKVSYVIDYGQSWHSCHTIDSKYSGCYSNGVESYALG